MRNAMKLCQSRAKQLPYPKFRRFAKDAIDALDDFVSVQLNEISRYIATKTKEYIEQLGGHLVQAVKGIDDSHCDALGNSTLLSGVLNEKTRDDHRHHAIDALVVALTTPKPASS